MNDIQPIFNVETEEGYNLLINHLNDNLIGIAYYHNNCYNVKINEDKTFYVKNLNNIEVVSSNLYDALNALF